MDINKKKQLSTYIFSTLVFVSAMLIVGSLANKRFDANFNNAKAGGYEYKFVLDPSNAPLTGDLGSHEVNNLSGYALNVSYENAEVLSGGHVRLAEGGSLTVNSKITGLYTIKPVFDGALKATFGLDDNTLVSKNLSSGLLTSLADGYYFDYIKIIATEPTDITTIEFIYSCSEPVDQITTSTIVTSNGGAIVTGINDKTYLGEKVFLHVEPFMDNTITSVSLNGVTLTKDAVTDTYIYKAGIDDAVQIITSLKNTVTMKQYTIDEITGDTTLVSTSEVTPVIDESGYSYTVNAPAMVGYSVDKDYFRSVLDSEHQAVSFYYSKIDSYDSGIVSTSLTGAGTEANPFLVDSAADYVYFASTVTTSDSYAGKFIKMTKSVDLTGLASASVRAGTSTRPFSGTFDGNNCAIRGINITSGSQQALFYRLDGRVKNLSTYGTNHSSTTASSFAVLLPGGVVENCSNYMAIMQDKAVGGAASGNAVGGLVGALQGGSIINSRNYANVTDVFTGTGTNKTAGLAGVIENSGGSIINSFNFGDVTGKTMVAGIVPFANNGIGITMLDVYNFGDVQSTAAGETCGIINNINLDVTDIDRVFNFGEIKSLAGSRAGGLFARVQGGSKSIDNSYNFGKVSATVDGVGGITGYIADKNETTNQTSNPVVFNNCKNFGEITSTFVGDAAVAGIVGKTFSLVPADAGYRVVTLNSCENFGYVDGNRRSGGLIGWAGNASINNSANYGDFGTRPGAISSNWNGGLVGTSLNLGSKASNLVILNSHNFGNVKVINDSVGGIVGSPSGNASLTITGCINGGRIYSSGTFAGGIVGQISTAAVSVTITGCINYGRIEASTGYAAGIFGNNAAQITTYGWTVNSNSNYGRIISSGIIGNLYSNL